VGERGGKRSWAGQNSQKREGGRDKRSPKRQADFGKTSGYGEEDPGVDGDLNQERNGTAYRLKKGGGRGSRFSVERRSTQRINDNKEGEGAVGQERTTQQCAKRTQEGVMNEEATRNLIRA